MKFLKGLDKDTEKKSYTCEEGGAHLRISFWHLLLNFEKPEKLEFWKNEKNLLEISSFYKCVPRTTIIWGTVPEIQNETNLFCHFGPFFALYHPPPNLTTQKTKILKKMKKASENVIILTLCNKKHDKMMYAYSDMECNRHNFLSFQAIFCSFTPLLTPKIKFWKKCKKHLEILCFYTYSP